LVASLPPLRLPGPGPARGLRPSGDGEARGPAPGSPRRGVRRPLGGLPLGPAGGGPLGRAGGVRLALRPLPGGGEGLGARLGGQARLAGSGAPSGRGQRPPGLFRLGEASARARGCGRPPAPGGGGEALGGPLPGAGLRGPSERTSPRGEARPGGPGPLPPGALPGGPALLPGLGGGGPHGVPGPGVRPVAAGAAEGSPCGLRLLRPPRGPLGPGAGSGGDGALAGGRGGLPEEHPRGPLAGHGPSGAPGAQKRGPGTLPKTGPGGQPLRRRRRPQGLRFGGGAGPRGGQGGGLRPA
jgi:hypothetical protein